METFYFSIYLFSSFAIKLLFKTPIDSRKKKVKSYYVLKFHSNLYCLFDLSNKVLFDENLINTI
jgi:hypothetical protein